MRRFVIGCVAATCAACSPAPGPSISPSPPTAVSARSTAPSSAAPVASGADAPVPVPEKERMIAMHRVMGIYSLIDLWPTEDGIELRLGLESHGGMFGWFRYVPLIDGVPDLSQETGRTGYVNTAWLRRSTTSAGNFIEIIGKRPNLISHKVSGFRSAASDDYWRLDDNRQWVRFSVANAPGVGIAIERWSKDRWLEWRAPDPEVPGKSAYVPQLRMLGFGEGQAPSYPKALSKRLEAEGFQLETYKVLRSGPVIAVGRRTLEEGYGTVIWENPAKPRYTVVETALSDDAELTILGGQVLSELRLLAGEQVMKLKEGAWSEESKLSKEGLPDVWFGTTLLRESEDGMWARTSADAPWARVQFHSEEKDVGRSFVVANNGAIWMAEGDVLYSNVKPTKPQPDITEEVLVKGRQASLLRGGSPDVTGEDPQPTFGFEACAANYLIIFRADKDKSLKADIARAVRALKGQKELVGAKFSVVVEGTLQFFGVRLADKKVANALYSVVRDKVKKSDVDLMCADPPVTREVKVDIQKGRVLP